MSLVLLLLLSNAESLFADSEYAIANEVIIASNPVHDNVAEKYIKAATGEILSQTTEVSHSAFKIFIPVEENLPDGAIIEEEEVDKSCSKLRTYIRKLRQRNAELREAGARQKIVYNFQCDPNSILNVAATPNDSRFSELWGLNQNNNIDMDLPEAWNKSVGSEEVIVAVIDTGIDYNHPDLSANMWRNSRELNGVSGVDDDANGVVDDIFGYNSINNSGNPMDDHYHGTHCAGTIGAVGNNAKGVVGVAQKVKLLGVKFLSNTGSGNLMDAVKSIDYVTNLKVAGHNIAASNNSWGGGGFYSSLRDAINRSSLNNILFVAAAGNDGQNIDRSPSYPASYDIPNVISVGAISASGAIASFSNYGVNSVDVMAPGVSILSTSLNNSYQYLNGTSMATPHISGAIALLRSYASTMSMTATRDLVFTQGRSVSGAIGKSKYGIMPSADMMLAEADRRGLGGILPSPPAPEPTATARPTATATATPTPTRTPTATPTVAPGYWNIKGYIDVGGKRLASAKVKLNINGQIFTAYSDAQGAFVFNNVYGPNNYTLEVISAGQSFGIKTGSLTGHIDTNFFGTPKDYKVTARIVREKGQGIAGLVVGESSSGAKLTNSAGEVDFVMPYGKEYNLSVDSSNFDFLKSELSGTVKGDVRRVFVALPDL
jgi:subtilisin family serine protease